MNQACRRRATCWLLLLAALSFGRQAAAIDAIAKHAVLVEMQTGAVLYEKNAYDPMAPASMSKMMTIYMLFERLRDGGLSLEDTLPVSKAAWKKGGPNSGGSTMFLEPGKRVRVEDLVRGVIVQSGNDACIVIAEGLASDEKTFAEQMTVRAREMGMEKTTFKNSTGLPDPEHLTTAFDLSILARRTIEDFPDLFHYYSEKDFTYGGVTQPNRNLLLNKGIGVDGMKTGHTEDAGYGLTATAKRGARRLILVINGLESEKARSNEAERLLDFGFMEFNNYALFKAGEEVLKADVWLGEITAVPLVINNDVVITMQRAARRKMKVVAAYQTPIPAPIVKGAELAKLRIAAPGLQTIELPLVAGASVNRLGFFGRMGQALNHIIFGVSR